MSTAGRYLYGFTDRRFQPAGELRGLAGAPLRVVSFQDVAAVVSSHPVKPLMPLRSNLEPHHRVVRQISAETTLVPAAFGHISDTEDEIVAVLRANYDGIRGELNRLEQKCEIGLKLTWAVDNIFEFMVGSDRGLRELRDRMFRRRQPSLNEKLEVGSAFEATLARERERLTQPLARERERLTHRLLSALEPVTCDVFLSPPRNEQMVCRPALLIQRARLADFEAALHRAASLFDAHYVLEYSGPWPPYSFVRLRLQRADPTAVA
jgi:hypothetical protein